MFTSIDEMNMYAWRKINETNDLRWMYPSGKGPVNKKVVKAWERIFDEFIDTFGISEQFARILDKKKEIAILTAEMHLYNDRSRETFIDIAKLELDELLNEGKGNSFIQTKIHIEKFLGFKLNEKETTVKEYYSYLQELQKQPTANPNGRRSD